MNNTVTVGMAGFDSKGVYRHVGEIVPCANPTTVDINTIALPGFDASGRQVGRKGRKVSK